ncbi:LysE family translocator [Kocuria rhizophila]|nr:LysE family translocator [Kocuria rhizophila]
MIVGELAWITLSSSACTVVISDNHVLKLAVRRRRAACCIGCVPCTRRPSGPRSAWAPCSREPQDQAARTRSRAAPRAPVLAARVRRATPVAHERRRGTRPHGPRHGSAALRRRRGHRGALHQFPPRRFLGRRVSPWALAQHVTNLANAKAVVFFVALLARSFRQDPLVGALAVLGIMVAVGPRWFLAVAWAGSIPPLRAGSRPHRRGRVVSGMVFALVAVGLLVEALLTIRHLAAAPGGRPPGGAAPWLGQALGRASSSRARERNRW